MPRISIRFLFSVVSLCVFNSCIGTSNVQILNENYKDIKVYNTSVTLFPLTEDFVNPQVWDLHTIQHPENKSAANDKNKGIFQRYFSTVFEEVTTASIIDGFDEKNLEARFEFIDTALPISEKDSLSFLVPSNSEAFINENEKTDYSLFVQSLHWQVAYGEAETQAVGRASSGSYNVEVRFQYVLWNNRKKEVVAYGKLNKKSQYLQVPSKTTYIEILEDLCRQIVVKSPLQETTTYG